MRTKLILRAACAPQIDSRTIQTRLTHHLTHGWAVSQSWLLLNEEGAVVGDAEVVVTSLSSDCAVVVRIGDQVSVLLARGLVHALQRMGVEQYEVA